MGDDGGRRLEQPFWVVGFPRSGTTLLAAMLDRHLALAVTPETSFLLPFNRGRLKAACGRDRVAARVAVCEMLRGWEVPEGWAAAVVERQLDDTTGTASPAKLMRVVLESYAELRGVERVGEKTPNHYRFADQLLDWFPGSKMVGMIRDGRDAVRSLVRVPGRTSDPLVYGRRWNRAVDRMTGLLTRYPDRFRLVRFEDLLTEPEHTLEEVTRFLGVGYSASQLDAETPTGVVGEGEWWKGGVNRSIDPSRVYAWKRDGLDRSMTAAAGLMGRRLERMGYESAAAVSRLGLASLHGRMLMNNACSWLRWRMSR